jgi:hypothetical protein
MSETTNVPAGTDSPPGREILVLGTLAAGFGALIGWLILSHFVRGIAEICHWDYLAAEADWLTPLATGLLNGLSSIGKNRARMQRRQQRRALGTEIGLQHSDRADDELTDNIADLYGGGLMSLSNILHRQFGPANLVVADMFVSPAGRAGKGQATEGTRTVVYLNDPAVRFPRFQMAPTDGPTRWLMRLAGFRGLDVSRHPEFAQRYQINSPDPAAVHNFFAEGLLSELVAAGRWYVHADGHRVLLWSQAEPTRPSAEDPSYLDDALALFQLLRTRAIAWPATEPVADVPPRLVAHAPARGLGSLVDCLEVTSQDIEQLLAQPTPRRPLPTSLHRQKFGFPIVPLVGLMFSVGGAIFFAAAGVEDLQVSNGKEWLLGWFGGGLLLLGLAMLTGALSYRWAWGRLLIHGQVTPGQVLQVHRTDVKVNDRRRFLVTVRYQANGQSITNQLAVYGRAGELAQQALASKQPLRVIFSPTRPKQAVVVEGLLG